MLLGAESKDWKAVLEMFEQRQEMWRLAGLNRALRGWVPDWP
jgi:hypothetical protein